MTMRGWRAVGVAVLLLAGCGRAPTKAASTSSSITTTTATGSASSAATTDVATAGSASTVPPVPSTRGSSTTSPTTTTTLPAPPPPSGSGLYGLVMAGPTCPVERPDQPCPPRPVAAHLTAQDGS